MFSNHKVNKILLITLLVLIPVIVTFQIRTAPWDLPQTDAWAEGSVLNFYRGQIANTVNAQYPNLPQAQKDSLINQQLEQFRATNKDQINQQVQETSAFFKTGFRYDENGNTYTFLGDLDSYFYLRQAKVLQEKGAICDTYKDGQCWDSYILAPLGGPVTPSMHPYGIVWLYNILKIFNPSVNLMQASFLLPTVLAAFAAVAAFFIGRRLMNEIAGFFAAMFVALSPMFITRTLGSDTDIWNMVFSLLIVWVFLEAFEARTMVKRVGFSVLVGFLMGIFAFAWGGWWYMLDFLLAGLIAYIIISLVRNYQMHRTLTKSLTREFQNDAIIFGVILVSSALFVSVFGGGFGNFMGAFLGPL
jgi:asparagine N-glycosylation enzyme membrane subunit Stt3